MQIYKESNPVVVNKLIKKVKEKLKFGVEHIEKLNLFNILLKD